MEIWKNLDDICLLQNVLDTLNEYCVSKEFDSEGWHTVLLAYVGPPRKETLTLQRINGVSVQLKPSRQQTSRINDRNEAWKPT